ncbi:unnamed protein product, partial [Ectocarpus sp. 8 AP-2014]
GEGSLKYDGKGRVKSDYCRYYNAKTQICSNDPCRFIHDINHVPEDTRGTRPGGRPYSSFDRDSRDHHRDRGGDHRGDRDRRSDRRDRDRDRDRDSDRGERGSSG